MKCEEVAEFVSALCDGERIPREAAEHIGACEPCRASLRQYAEMGAELRRVASLESAEEVRVRRWEKDQRIKSNWWWKGWETMRIPRFAFALLLIALVGLGSSLVMVTWAGRGEEFQFTVTSPSSGDSMRGGFDVGEEGTVQLGGLESQGYWAAKFKLLGVDRGVVRLDVQTHNFESEPNAADVRQALSVAAHRVYDYIPGQTLAIPVDGGDTLTLVGKLVEKRPETTAPSLASDAVQINRPALFQDGKLVAELKGSSASAQGEDSAVGILIPKEGRYFFTLKPIENAVPGEAYFGQVRFQLDGKNYLLASATPVTGDVQPRQIWVYHDQLISEGISSPAVTGGAISKLMQKPE